MGPSPLRRKPRRRRTLRRGEGPFPQRLPELQLAGRFITDFYLLVLDWARWAAAIVETWPDDPRQATHDPQVIAETVKRARRAAGTTTTPQRGQVRENGPRDTTTAAAGRTARKAWLEPQYLPLGANDRDSAIAAPGAGSAVGHVDLISSGP
jgi:hypothetical protein